VIELLRRKEGVTAAEIARRTDWQPHTIRGFISTISKKMKLAIESVRNEQGQRVYRVK
jgi:DNA-binding MarR family transcriptional regulator